MLSEINKVFSATHFKPKVASDVNVLKNALPCHMESDMVPLCHDIGHHHAVKNSLRTNCWLRLMYDPFDVTVKQTILL